MILINPELLIRLLFAHVIGDFILQPTNWVKDRNANNLKSKFLYIHSAIHGILAYLFLAEWNNYEIPLLIFITHLIIDALKSWLRLQTISSLLIEQSFHVIVILSIWLFHTSQWNLTEYFIRIMFSTKNSVILLSYLIVIWPSSVIINQATRKWYDEFKNDSSKGLQNAGKWIGRLERILVLTFILIDEVGAIGFLIATKSIFRFGDLKNKQDRKRTEYILIGTFLSFTLTILLGILLRILIIK